jgi:uncharacterized protein YdeI (YjbR/CyaY-like superfamily)
VWELKEEKSPPKVHYPGVPMSNPEIEKNQGSLPVLLFKAVGAFEKWLAGRGADDAGAWLKFAKKATKTTSISKQEAIDLALCYGWIDGQLDKFDAEYFLIRFTPRRSRSKWSKINRERAVALIDAGRMTDRGLAEIERAKADGRWDAAYAPASKATVPDDLKEALEQQPKARDFFSTLDRQNRYAILYRIHDAKKPETRAARIVKYVDMLARSEAPYPRKED